MSKIVCQTIQESLNNSYLSHVSKACRSHISNFRLSKATWALPSLVVGHVLLLFSTCSDSHNHSSLPSIVFAELLEDRGIWWRTPIFGFLSGYVSFILLPSAGRGSLSDETGKGTSLWAQQSIVKNQVFLFLGFGSHVVFNWRSQEYAFSGP